MGWFSSKSDDERRATAEEHRALNEAWHDDPERMTSAQRERLEDLDEEHALRNGRRRMLGRS